MNVNFEMAMQLINLEDYDAAVRELKAAVASEKKNKNEIDAAKYRCVLAELLAELDRTAESVKEFQKVAEFCDKTGELPKQREIAYTFLNTYAGGSAPDIPAPKPRPAQDRGFIASKMNKRKRK